ncbi:unnamed protein product [Cunninghamella echinulata]
MEVCSRHIYDEPTNNDLIGFDHHWGKNWVKGLMELFLKEPMLLQINQLPSSLNLVTQKYLNLNGSITSIWTCMD